MSTATSRYVDVDTEAVARAIREYLPPKSERMDRCRSGRWAGIDRPVMISLGDFAETCGLSERYVLHMMRGDRPRASYELLDRLAVGLNCHVSMFIRDEAIA